MLKDFFQMNLNKYKKLDRLLYIFSFLFFSIPLFIFFICWYKVYIFIPVYLIVLITFKSFLKNINYKSEEQYKNIFNLKKWIIVIILLLILNLLSGIGGYTFQNWDYNARNAVMNDLIKYDYPIKYNYDSKIAYDIIGDTGYMSYYFAYWLPSCVVGKIFGYEACNMAIFIYQFIGLVLFYYFLSRIFSKVRLRYFFIIIAFSGLDVIGQYITDVDKLELGSHIDTWSPYFCTSSNITQLFWVFNQCIPGWLITVLLLNEKNFKNVAIYMAFILMMAPFPAVGYALIILILLILGLYKFENKIKKTTFKERFLELFSKQNIIMLIVIILLSAFYLINPHGQNKGLYL